MVFSVQNASWKLEENPANVFTLTTSDGKSIPVTLAQAAALGAIGEGAAAEWKRRKP